MKTTKALSGILPLSYLVWFLVPVLATQFNPSLKASTGATAVATISNGVVVKLELTNPGNGYTTYDALVSFSGGGGTGAQAMAGGLGKLSYLSLSSGGEGYRNPPDVIIETPEQAAARVNALEAEKARVKKVEDEQDQARDTALRKMEFDNHLHNFLFYVVPILAIGALLYFLKKRNQKAEGKQSSSLSIIGAVAVVGFLLMALLITAIENGKLMSSSPKQSSSSSSITESDVLGRWVGEYQGHTSMDITLLSGGSFISSASDFAGGRLSSGTWRISGGNTVVIDYGDGGENLLFSYKNGQLVAANGRALNRK